MRGQAFLSGSERGIETPALTPPLPQERVRGKCVCSDGSSAALGAVPCVEECSIPDLPPSCLPLLGERAGVRGTLFHLP